MEIKSGFIFAEKLVTNRRYRTWWKNVGGILSKFKNILSFTSDGGQALIKLGKKISCDNIMDLFHLQQDVKSLFATIFHSKRKSLLSKRKKLRQNKTITDDEKKIALKEISTGLELLDKGQAGYRNALFVVSTASHPFKGISETKTSQELEDELHEQLQNLKTITEQCKINDKRELLKRFEGRITLSARLNDLWHGWVDQALLCKTQCPELIGWVKHTLLPVAYLKEQLRKSRKKPRLKSYYQNLVDEAKVRLENDPLTAEYFTEEWMAWSNGIALKYQRSTSAIEGRNARLAHHYFSARGIRPEHISSLTHIHNFWIKRADGTTAAERLCGYKPPDLFEYILKNMPPLPLPRNPNIPHSKKIAVLN